MRKSIEGNVSAEERKEKMEIVVRKKRFIQHVLEIRVVLC